MKVCVQGLWHLGSVTAACLASAGHHVTGLDFDSKTINGLQQGKAPIGEPGIDALLQAGIAEKRLHFISSATDIPSDTEVLWVAYDTPVDDDDRADVDFVVTQIEKTLPSLPAGTTILVSSQLPVGSIRRLESFAAKSCPEKKLGFACSPENLRLGKALDVFLKPDRIVVGVRSPHDRAKLEKLLLPVTDKIEWMSVESAEMTKHAINAFLATSVTFANEVAALCEMVGADAKEVERGLKSESRIGPKAYLSPGGAFAGGTLARDVAFLTDAAAKNTLSMPLLAAVKPSNDEHKHWVRRKLLERFPTLSHVPVAVWGLTYKPGTNTLRRSLAVELCNWLIEQGAELRVHDPEVGQLPAQWRGVKRCESALDAVTSAKALIIATEWPQYRTINVEQITTAAPGLVVIDANRFLSGFAGNHNITYVAVGTPKKMEATS